MESYSVGERLFLQFKVEQMQGKKFTLGSAGDVAPYFVLSLGKKTIVPHGVVSIINGNTLKLWFKPEEIGQHVLDIWYFVKVGEIGAENMPSVSDEAYECRTVRFILPVVR